MLGCSFLRGGENRMQIKCSQALAKSQKMCYNENKSIIRRKNMIIVNTDYITGKQFEMLGLVSGSTIQSKHIGKDIGASFKTLVGGELKGYTEMMNEARSIATRRMVAVATQLGADAIVNVRFASSAVMQGAAEIIVYGTAVKFI